MSNVYIAETGSCNGTTKTKTTSTPLPTERRREPRQILQETVGTSFYNNRELYHASVVDLSSGGASLRFETESADTVPKLYTGKTMECYFTTPNGRSKCRGTVRWMRKTISQVTWGISFLELSTDGGDPFRSVISEVCR